MVLRKCDGLPHLHMLSIQWGDALPDRANNKGYHEVTEVLEGKGLQGLQG